MTDVAVSLATDEASARDIAKLFARHLPEDTRYISSGEIKWGMSPDGERWAEGASDILAQDIRDIALNDGPNRVLQARAASGDLVGALVLHMLDLGGRRTAVANDMMVAPDWRRRGVADALLTEAQDIARQAGADWMFAEIGPENEASWRFFEKRGYALASRVVGRPL